ncbi:MAG: acyl carrier protein [Lachnospiraceae bacterium]|nr:acyl carrier protein [Lachnospiraceae bacterium]MCM1237842.1 acyl carrier protein [Lachnospiraceae bacterium]
MEARKWIIDWMASNSGVSEEEISKNSAANYFDKEYIDSFAFIMFISEIEETFDMTFDNEQFEDRAFSTIDGLAECIEKGRKI